MELIWFLIVLTMFAVRVYKDENDIPTIQWGLIPLIHFYKNKKL